MESNYLKSLQIKVAQHPEWDEDKIWQEVKKIYELAYRIGNNIFIIPVEDDRPIKVIYEGGQYEK